MLNNIERGVIQMDSIAPKTMKEFMECLRKSQETYNRMWMKLQVEIEKTKKQKQLGDGRKNDT